jgi:hypothetical protein
MYTLFANRNPIVRHADIFNAAFRATCEEIVAHYLRRILNKYNETDVEVKVTILNRIVLEQLGIFFGMRKIDTIKLIRGLLNCGLGAAKEIAEFAETVKVEYTCIYETTVPEVDENTVVLILN